MDSRWCEGEGYCHRLADPVTPETVEWVHCLDTSGGERGRGREGGGREEEDERRERGERGRDGRREGEEGGCKEHLGVT